MGDDYFSIHPPEVVRTDSRHPPPSPLSSAPNTPENPTLQKSSFSRVINFSDTDHETDQDICDPPRVSRQKIPPSMSTMRGPTFSKLPSAVTGIFPQRRSQVSSVTSTTSTVSAKKKKKSSKKRDTPFDESSLTLPQLHMSSTERTLRMLKGESLSSHDVPDDEKSTVKEAPSKPIFSPAKKVSFGYDDEAPDDEKGDYLSKRNILAEMDAFEDNIFSSRSADSDTVNLQHSTNTTNDSDKAPNTIFSEGSVPATKENVSTDGEIPLKATTVPSEDIKDTSTYDQDELMGNEKASDEIPEDHFVHEQAEDIPDDEAGPMSTFVSRVKVIASSLISPSCEVKTDETESTEKTRVSPGAIPVTQSPLGTSGARSVSSTAHVADSVPPMRKLESLNTDISISTAASCMAIETMQSMMGEDDDDDEAMIPFGMPKAMKGMETDKELKDELADGLALPDEDISFDSILTDASYFSSAAYSTIAAAGEAVGCLVMGSSPTVKAKTPEEMAAEWRIRKKEAILQAESDLEYKSSPFKYISDKAFVKAKSEDSDEKTNPADNRIIDDLKQESKHKRKKKKKKTNDSKISSSTPSRSASVSSNGDGGWWLEKELSRREQEKLLISGGNLALPITTSDENSPSLVNSSSTPLASLPVSLEITAPITETSENIDDDSKDIKPKDTEGDAISPNSLTLRESTFEEAVETGPSDMNSDDFDESTTDGEDVILPIAKSDTKAEREIVPDSALVTPEGNGADKANRGKVPVSDVESVATASDLNLAEPMKPTENIAIETYDVVDDRMKLPVETEGMAVSATTASGALKLSDQSTAKASSHEDPSHNEATTSGIAAIALVAAKSSRSSSESVTEDGTDSVSTQETTKVEFTDKVEMADKSQNDVVVQEESTEGKIPRESNTMVEKAVSISKHIEVTTTTKVNSGPKEPNVDWTSAAVSEEKEIAVTDQSLVSKEKDNEHDSKVAASLTESAVVQSNTSIVAATTDLSLISQTLDERAKSTSDAVPLSKDFTPITEEASISVADSYINSIDNDVLTLNSKEPLMGEAIESVFTTKTEVCSDESAEAESSDASVSSSIREGKPPVLVEPLDDVLGICKGDIVLSLVHAKGPRETTSTSGGKQVRNAIWRMRAMRHRFNWRHEDQLRKETSAPGSPSNGGTFSEQPSAEMSAENEELLELRTRDLQKKTLEHLRRGEFSEADELYDEILQAYNEEANREGGLAKEELKPYLGNALHNMGIICILNQDYKEAREYLKRALHYRTSTDDSPSSDELATLVKIAYCYFALDDFQTAHKKLRICLEFAQGYCQTITDIIQVAEILNNVGCLYFMCGKSETAIGMFKESLDVQKTVQSHCMYSGAVLTGHASSLNMSVTRANIAFLRMCSKDHLAAILTFESALAAQQMLLDDAHETLIGTMDHLAVSNLLHGDKEKATNMLKRMLQAQIHAYGEDDPRCVKTMNKIAMVSSNNHRIRKAVAMISKAHSVEKALREANADFDEQKTRHKFRASSSRSVASVSSVPSVRLEL